MNILAATVLKKDPGEDPAGIKGRVTVLSRKFSTIFLKLTDSFIRWKFLIRIFSRKFNLVHREKSRKSGRDRSESATRPRVGIGGTGIEEKDFSSKNGRERPRKNAAIFLIIRMSLSGKINLRSLYGLRIFEIFLFN